MPLLPSGLPEAVADDEWIARFLTQSGHFSKRRIQPSAFLPSKKSQETSVSRHGRDPVDSLRELGRIAAGDRNLYGAAVIKARHVRTVSLKVESNEPPPRHAVIRGWPWLENDPVAQKARQKQLAIVLASDAGEPLLFKDG